MLLAQKKKKGKKCISRRRERRVYSALERFGSRKTICISSRKGIYSENPARSISFATLSQRVSRYITHRRALGTTGREKKEKKNKKRAAYVYTYVRVRTSVRGAINTSRTNHSIFSDDFPAARPTNKETRCITRGTTTRGRDGMETKGGRLVRGGLLPVR